MRGRERDRWTEVSDPLVRSPNTCHAQANGRRQEPNPGLLCGRHRLNCLSHCCCPPRCVLAESGIRSRDRILPRDSDMDVGAPTVHQMPAPLQGLFHPNDYIYLYIYIFFNLLGSFTNLLSLVLNSSFYILWLLYLLLLLGLF